MISPLIIIGSFLFLYKDPNMTYSADKKSTSVVGDRYPSNAFANALLRFPRLLLSFFGISGASIISQSLTS